MQQGNLPCGPQSAKQTSHNCLYHHSPNNNAVNSNHNCMQRKSFATSDSIHALKQKCLSRNVHGVLACLEAKLYMVSWHALKQEYTWCSGMLQHAHCQTITTHQGAYTKSSREAATPVGVCVEVGIQLPAQYMAISAGTEHHTWLILNGLYHQHCLHPAVAQQSKTR